MTHERILDLFLEKRLKTYDTWLEQDKICFSSKIVPVRESLDHRQWILPSEQVMELIRQARSLAVQPCECRTHYKRCSKPLEVCLVFNTVADALVSKNKARPVDLQEASEIIRNANTHGLIHLSLYMPDHQVYALCSCCECCCHDLQIVRLMDRPELMVCSDYRAVTDSDACNHCGLCVDRCLFNARSMVNGRMEYRVDACFGCGLCVTSCSAEATAMVLRNTSEGHSGQA